MKTNARGNLVLVLGDTGKGLYAASGATRVTVVSGLSPVPAYAADGSLNIVVSSTGYGYYHPCGAIRITPATGQVGLVAPDGSSYAEGISAAFLLVNTYSPTDGLALSASDNSLAIRDSVAPANDYTGPLLNADGTVNKFTFTRASTATKVNSSGLIVAVPANELRIDYTQGYAALLIEGAATNLCLQSEAFNTTWASVNTGTGLAAVVTANFATAPDGTATAERLQLSLNGGTAAGDQSALRQTGITTVAASVYTAGLYVKANGAGEVGKVILIRHVGAVNYTTKTLTADWQRVTVTETAIGVSSSFEIVLRGSLGSSDSADFLVWGAQLELGSIATSYIPTAGATATRAADGMTIANTLFNLTQSAGTLYVKNYWNGGTAVAPGTRAPMSVSNTTFAELHVIYNNAGVPTATTLDGSIPQDSLAGSAVANATLAKSAYAYALNDFAYVQNGGAPVIDLSGTLPTTTRLEVGRYIAATLELNGGITELAFFGTRLSNATMQTLTT